MPEKRDVQQDRPPRRSKCHGGAREDRRRYQIRGQFGAAARPAALGHRAGKRLPEASLPAARVRPLSRYRSGGVNPSPSSFTFGWALLGIVTAILARAVNKQTYNEC